jgi:nucleoside-diphosphate-sugar epimerase
VRPFNTYGPRQSARAVIPTVITQVQAGKKSIELGNLAPTRDLTFVRDTCTGFLEIYESEKLFGGVTNIGMNTEISIGDLAEKIIGLMKSNTEIIQNQERVRPGQSEVDRLVCNNGKILKGTEWKPEYDLDKGLKETINWFIETDNIYKSQIYNI